MTVANLLLPECSFSGLFSTAVHSYHTAWRTVGAQEMLVE